jgi:radical SAM family RiPP maturation amino acid epimerase
MQRYRAFIREKMGIRPNWRGSRSLSPAFDAWRQRQINRCFSELGIAKGDAIVHSAAAFELCRGCSVGCWFCGIGAKKLAEVWPYTEENGQLWRGTVQALHDLVGEPAKHGFCYWATDPLDNPDYERYCIDFHDIMGRFPQTTTAQPLRDPERIKNLLALSRSRGGEVDRFSVLSRGTLRKVFETYTARELLHVELVLQMEGNTSSKAFAGNAREHEARYERHASQPPQEQATGSTIACVSGFLVRMPDRLIELVSPCAADARWPLGYRVHDRRTFDCAQHLREQICNMISPTQLPMRLGIDAKVRWRKDLRLELCEEGFSLSTGAMRHDFKNTSFPAMRDLGALLTQGLSAAEVSLQLSETPVEETLSLLQKLYMAGLIDDEPHFSQRADDTELKVPPSEALANA